MTVESLPNRSLKHIPLLNPLRGLMALGVVLFHYSGSILPTINPNYLTDLLAYGKYGVHVFFVISGFIIPYSMYWNGYKIADLGIFMCKRFIRIAPAAYIAAGLMILFHLLALWILGRPVDTEDWPGLNARSILGNLLFHPYEFDTKWFNFPYWTLMIEFQFYVLIGVVFPLLMDPKKIGRTLITLLLILFLSLLDQQYFFRFSPFFILGLVVFLYQHSLIDRISFSLLAVVGLGLCLFHDITALSAAAITGIMILTGVQFNNYVLTNLGKISYSLYIIHVPVGHFAESSLKRVTDLHEDPVGKVIMLFIYTAIALVFAAIFYKLVEKPFIQYSKKIFAKQELHGPFSGSDR